MRYYRVEIRQGRKAVRTVSPCKEERAAIAYCECYNSLWRPGSPKAYMIEVDVDFIHEAAWARAFAPMPAIQRQQQGRAIQRRRQERRKVGVA